MTERLQTLEGWYISQDFRSFDWPAWKALSPMDQAEILEDFMAYYNKSNGHNEHGSGAFACYEILGQKADFLWMNLRADLHKLADAEREFNQTRLAGFMMPSYSFISVVELGNYVHDSNGQISEEAQKMVNARLYPKLPNAKHVCFYPMNKKRGEKENWYLQNFEDRRRMMKDHGMTGRKYAGKIVQMIGGSIGFDDWEWGVTLFANEPLDLKHIVTEMRFDEVSARFAEFGPFYVGNKLNRKDLIQVLSSLN